MAKGKSALALALKKKIGSNDEIQKVSHWIDSGFGRVSTTRASSS